MSLWNIYKAAVVEALKADAIVSEKVGSRVYDEIPRDDRGVASDARAPFVYLGVLSWRDIASGCGAVFDVSLRLFAVSSKFGRDESREIGAAIRAALHEKTLELPEGYSMTAVRAVAGGDMTATENPKEFYVDLRVELSEATGLGE
jgi:hypothetical protein